MSAAPARAAAGRAEAAGALLEVAGLCARVPTPRGPALAVDGVGFELRPGGALALVGESGAGKTLTALAIPRLAGPGVAYAGSVRFEGRELLGADERELERLRGRAIGYLPQEASSALDPLRTVGAQVAEALGDGPGTSGAARAGILALLARLGFADPERAARSFAHELSGGMRQRALYAAAVVAQPKLIVLDEPTSALDPASAAAMLAHAREQRARGAALLVVTHDLALARAHAEGVHVLYAGRVVEHGPARELFERPRHPYTRGLLPARVARAARGARLEPIPGVPPGLSERGAGCAFRPRCPLALARCAAELPPLAPAGAARASACFAADEVLPP